MIRKVLWVVLVLGLFGGILSSCGTQKMAEEYYEQGKKLYEKKEFDQAISSYNEAIKLNPKLVKAYNNRGIVYVVKSQLDQAIADFNKAIELDPNNGKAYNNRAVAYWYKGDTAKARQDIAKAQSLGIQIKVEMLEKLPKPSGKSD